MSVIKPPAAPTAPAAPVTASPAVGPLVLPPSEPIDPEALARIIEDRVVKSLESHAVATGKIADTAAVRTRYRAFLRALLYWIVIVIVCLVVAILDHSWTVMIVVILAAIIPIIGIVENAGDSAKQDVETKLAEATAKLKAGTDLLTSPLQIPALLSQLGEHITKAIKAAVKEGK